MPPVWKCSWILFLFLQKACVERIDFFHITFVSRILQNRFFGILQQIADPRVRPGLGIAINKPVR